MSKKLTAKEQALALCPQAYEYSTARQVWIQVGRQASLTLSAAYTYSLEGTKAVDKAWASALSVLQQRVSEGYALHIDIANQDENGDRYVVTGWHKYR